MASWYTCIVWHAVVSGIESIGEIHRMKRMRCTGKIIISFLRVSTKRADNEKVSVFFCWKTSGKRPLYLKRQISQQDIRGLGRAKPQFGVQIDCLPIRLWCVCTAGGNRCARTASSVFWGGALSAALYSCVRNRHRYSSLPETRMYHVSQYERSPISRVPVRGSMFSAHYWAIICSLSGCHGGLTIHKNSRGWCPVFLMNWIACGGMKMVSLRWTVRFSSSICITPLPLRM